MYVCGVGRACLASARTPPSVGHLRARRRLDRPSQPVPPRRQAPSDCIIMEWQRQWPWRPWNGHGLSFLATSLGSEHRTYFAGVVRSAEVSMFSGPKVPKTLLHFSFPLEPNLFALPHRFLCVMLQPPRFHDPSWSVRSLSARSALAFGRLWPLCSNFDQYRQTSAHVGQRLRESGQISLVLTEVDQSGLALANLGQMLNTFGQCWRTSGQSSRRH